MHTIKSLFGVLIKYISIVSFMSIELQRSFQNVHIPSLDMEQPERSMFFDRK